VFVGALHDARFHLFLMSFHFLFGGVGQNAISNLILALIGAPLQPILKVADFALDVFLRTIHRRPAGFDASLHLLHRHRSVVAAFRVASIHVALHLTKEFLVQLLQEPRHRRLNAILHLIHFAYL